MMADYTLTMQKRYLPFKSIAGALWLSVILGPIGLLYSSIIGGILLTAIALTAFKFNFLFDLLLVWICSCVWGVWAANRYNRNLVKAP
jgi:hypothetical protein